LPGGIFRWFMDQGLAFYLRRTYAQYALGLSLLLFGPPVNRSKKTFIIERRVM
jgi:hypothetical protein